MNGWVIAWGLAMSIIAIAFVLIIRLERRSHKKLYQAWLVDMTQKNDDIHKLVTSVGEARTQRDKLNTENANLHAQLADRNEALQEAMAEIKALQMNTIEVQEAAPEPVKPRSGGRGKGKAGQA